MTQNFGLNHEIPALAKSRRVNDPQKISDWRLASTFRACHSCHQMLHDLIKLVDDEVCSVEEALLFRLKVDHHDLGEDLAQDATELFVIGDIGKPNVDALELGQSGRLRILCLLHQSLSVCFLWLTKFCYN